MGVQDLLPFVAKHAAAAVTRLGTDMRAFRGQRAALDVAIEMYKAAYTKGTDVGVLCDWFGVLHRRFAHDGIEVTYVFDGALVDAKLAEVARRTDTLVKNSARASLARARLAALQAAADADTLEALCGSRGSYTTSAGEASVDVDGVGGSASVGASVGGSGSIEVAEAEVKKLEARLVKPHRVHYDAVREFLTVNGAACVVAPTEAEKECARLCRRGDVDFVITNDSDALAFGAPRVVFNYGKDTAYLVTLDGVLRALDLDLARFQQLCVMLGCDFCERVPGVGPERAYKLLADARRGGSIAAVLAARDAARDPKFSEAVAADALDAAEAEEGQLASQVAELHDALAEGGGDGDNAALAAQANRVAALLDGARRARAAASKQLAGIRDFKRRYPIAVAMFSDDATPDETHASASASTSTSTSTRS